MTKEQVIEFFKSLWNPCLDEIMKEAYKGANMIIAIIRKYNRKWNEKAETEPILIPDGFNKYAKAKLFEIPRIPEELKNALYYL